MIQWLRLHTPSTEGEVSISGWRNEIPHATQHSKKELFKVKALSQDLLVLMRDLGDPVT